MHITWIQNLGVSTAVTGAQTEFAAHKRKSEAKYSPLPTTHTYQLFEDHPNSYSKWYASTIEGSGRRRTLAHRSKRACALPFRGQFAKKTPHD
jgi:hypothetical protein